MSKNEDNNYNTDVHKVKLIIWWISLTYSTRYQHTYDMIYACYENIVQIQIHIFSDWDIFWYTIALCTYCQSGDNFIWYYIYKHIVKVVTISYDITFIHISSDLTTFSYHFILIQISSELRCTLIPYYIFTHIVWLLTFW